MRLSAPLFCLLLALSAGASASGRIDREHAVVDPGYGAILFEYYQQHWFAAMTQALMALDTGTLPTQRTQAQILLGALYAHYGMPDEAEALFRSLLAQSVDPALAPGIWLHLAELHYRKQRYADALALLDEQIGTPPAELLRSFHALRTRQSGMQRFISVHVLVPGDWTVHRGHELLEKIEADIRSTVPG